MNHLQVGTILKRAKLYLPHLKETRIREAYDFAKKAHRGQYRLDGSPYMTHPLAATLTLTDLHLDEDALMACLMHDVPEDTAQSLEDIEKKFGPKISFLIDGVTKLSKVKYRYDMVERQVDSLKKFFLHSSHDLRIILIKLADRLHNMQTLDYVRKEKQLRIARETMEIYVPIANLLGIWEIKSKLEDLCFHTIYPKEYAQLERRMQQVSVHQKKMLKATGDRLIHELEKHGIGAELEYRPKSLFSVFQKMVKTSKGFEDVNDILGLRLIVKTEEECYRVLGIAHRLFRPTSHRIKDYIALPKSNGYQSLHTTVFGVQGVLTEIQIRTEAMHFEAQYGVAAHYFYKQGKNGAQPEQPLEKRSSWMKKILELQQDLKNNADFMKNLKSDVFSDRIFVFTPKGEVIDLPEGAIGLDFAYHIHSDLGDRGVKLIRSGKEFPITSTLQTGETVQVIPSDKQHGPKREWLEKVKTNLAKRKIKESLKRQTQIKSYHEGIDFLKRELHRLGCHELATLTPEQKHRLIESFRSKNWHQFLESVGDGTISKYDVIQVLYTPQEILGEPHHSEMDYSPLSNIHYRKVEGEFIASPQIQSAPYYRLLLEIKTLNRVGLLRDLGIQLADLSVNIYSIAVRQDKKIREINYIDLTIEVVDLEQLKNTFDAIEAIDGVVEVIRPQKNVAGIHSAA